MAAFILFCWHLIFGLTLTAQKETHLMNPLQGYSMQSERIWDSPNLFSKLAENTRTDSDDKDDSEDHDDDVNETAYLNKVNQEGQLPAFNRNQLVIFAYHDRLSQAHTYPITTPPDTYLDHLNC